MAHIHAAITMQVSRLSAAAASSSAGITSRLGRCCGHVQVTLGSDDIAVFVQDGDHIDMWSSGDRGKTWGRTCAAVVGAARAFAACFVHGTLVVLSSDEAKGSSDRGRTWGALPMGGLGGALHDLAMCVDRDECVFVVGAGRGRPQALYRSDDGCRSWSHVLSPTWGPRKDMSIVSVRSELLVIGGCALCVDGSPSEYVNDVWASANKGGDWSLACRSAPWCGRYGQACVATEDGAVVLMGGVFIEETFEERRLGDVWSSRDAGRSWVCVTSCAPWGPRSNVGASAVGAHAIIITGGRDSNSDALDDVWQSSDGGTCWTNVTAAQRAQPELRAFFLARLDRVDGDDDSPSIVAAAARLAALRPLDFTHQHLAEAFDLQRRAALSEARAAIREAAAGLHALEQSAAWFHLATEPDVDPTPMVMSERLVQLHGARSDIQRARHRMQISALESLLAAERS